MPAGEHLATVRLGGDTCGLVHALAAVSGADASRRRPVQPDANLRRKSVIAAMVGQCPLDLHRALEGAVGLFETDEEAVAGVVDLLAGVRGKQPPQRVVVP